MISMENKTLFTLKQAAQWCGGTVFGKDVAVNSVIIDSRDATNAQGIMFVALKGENTDGHKYIKSAIENGACCALCEQAPEGVNALVVNDALQGLDDIAEGYKRNIKTTTIGITGSVGKTTTKEMASAVFATQYKTHKSEGNFNSVIGLPLVVFGMPEDTQAAVFEMGMSNKGEISAMAKIARPNAAIITNVGTSHIEMLGSRENILKAKLEIADYFDESGILVMNGDDPFLWGEKDTPVKYKKIYTSAFNEDADFQSKNIRFAAEGVKFDVYIKAENRTVADISVPAAGMHNVYNATNVFACAYSMGISEDNIKKGLLNYKTTGLRQKIYSVGNYTVIADCYNASPESMKASSKTLVQLAKDKNTRSHAVLGEMRELGAASTALHIDVGASMYQNGVDFLYLWGTNASVIAKGAEDAGMPKERIFVFYDGASYDELSAALLKNMENGDAVMFKASRFVKLEDAIENFEGNFKQV